MAPVNALPNPSETKGRPDGRPFDNALPAAVLRR